MPAWLEATLFFAVVGAVTAAFWYGMVELWQATGLHP